MKAFLLGLLASISTSAIAATVNVDIVGMSCGMCEGKVTEQLQKTGKVKAVKVDAGKKQAIFETTGPLTDAEIKKAVQEAGYEAVKITRT